MMKGISKAILLVALRDIKKDKKMFILVIFALTFSYVNLTLFSAISMGFEGFVYGITIDLLTGHIIIEPEEGLNYIDNVRSVERKIILIPGVVGVSPRLEVNGILLSKGDTKGVNVVGIDPGKDVMVTTLNAKIIDGAFFDGNDPAEIILSKPIANDLNVQVGEKVAISFSGGQQKTYHIKGLSYSGFGFLDESTVYLTRKNLEETLGMKDEATSILIRLYDPYSAEEYKELLYQQGIRGEIKTWYDKGEFARSIARFWIIIRAITILVGSITAATTIAIIIYINTVRKTRQIGILRAIGATKKTVLSIFLVEAMIFGVFGTIVGNLIISGIVFNLTVHPLNTPMGEIVPILTLNTVVQGSVLLLATCFIAGLIPSWNLARKNIIRTIGDAR